MMKRICAWCGKDMGTKEGPEGKETYGICQPCKEAVVRDVRETPRW